MEIEKRLNADDNSLRIHNNQSTVASFSATKNINDDDANLKISKSDLENSTSTTENSKISKSIDCETISISASDLSRLLRSSIDEPVSILDCRSIDCYKKGHCLNAEHVSAPPTLLYHRLKSKPDFWSGIRRRLVIPDFNKNGEASKIVLIDDDCLENDSSANGFINRSTTNQQQQRSNQSFSSFLLANLRIEGCTTFLLEKGGMSHFLDSYPDLCVFEQDLGGDFDDENKTNDISSTTSVLDGRPSENDSFLSRQQSSPFLLPMLKLKDLNMSDSSFSPRIIDDDAAIKKKSDQETTTCHSTPSCSTTGDFDYDRFSNNFPSSSQTMSENSNEKDPVKIFSTLYLGNVENAKDLETLRRFNIKYILNVTLDLPNQFENERGFKYLRIPIVDNVSSNLVNYFPLANEFIDEAIDKSCGVLVHCLAGISRSVTFTVAYLMKSKSCSMDEAYEIVKQKKPNIEPNLNFMRQLFDYERSLTRSLIGGDVTPDSAVSSLSTSSSSSVCVDSIAIGENRDEKDQHNTTPTEFMSV